LPGIVGNNNHNNFISNMVKNTILNKKLVYFGGSNLFNNIYHIDDLVKVIKVLLKYNIKKNFEIINIGARKSIKINQIIHMLTGKKQIINLNIKKNNNFTISVDKLNKYYKINPTTKFFIKKYLNEELKRVK
jgi:nucleoside-diphosphate-sugar epimerase